MHTTLAAPAAPLSGAAGAPSPATLRTLEGALQTLLAPLDYPDWQTWQVAVHGRLLALTRADALCVYTPLTEGPAAWYTPHVSDAALADYGARVAADPAWEVVERGFSALGRDVAHEEELMPRAALEASAFYREFLLPNRILDLTVAGADFGGIAPARLHFSNTSLRGAEQAAERAALVRAVLPAFRAGLALWRQMGDRRLELARMVDALSDAVLLYDAAGGLAHANVAAVRLLEGGPDTERLRAEAQRIAWTVGAMARRGAGASTAAPTMRELRVGARTFRVHGALAPAGLLGRDHGVLVTIEALAARVPTDAELRERYGLTPRELEVARRVAAGLSNQELAESLGISFFTARNHVERLLPKLGVSNRARVGAILRGES